MRALLCAFSLLAASQASAQRDPFVGPDRFPEYRNLSGLSGAGYGLDKNGRASLSGPTAFSTPIAHVLGHSQFRLHMAKASFTGRPEFHEDSTNGTLAGSYGHTLGGFNIMIAQMMLATNQVEDATNLQIQIPTPAARPFALSLGVQGMFGAAKSHGVTEPPGKSSRSAFACGTYEVPGALGRLYLTAGIGTRRFDQGFASASWQVSRPIRLWIEHDGFGLNQGLLFTCQRPMGARILEWNLAAGYLQNRYFTFAAGVGF